MGMLLCEQNFRDVWSRNESVRAEIVHILHTDTHTHTHTAKLVVEVALVPVSGVYPRENKLIKHPRTVVDIYLCCWFSDICQVDAVSVHTVQCTLLL